MCVCACVHAYAFLCPRVRACACACGFKGTGICMYLGARTGVRAATLTCVNVNILCFLVCAHPSQPSLCGYPSSECAIGKKIISEPEQTREQVSSPLKEPWDCTH